MQSLKNNHSLSSDNPTPQQLTFRTKQYQHFDSFAVLQPLHNQYNNPQRANRNFVYQSAALKKQTAARAHLQDSMYMDSIEVDYRQKTFELMKKNAELELNIKQSKADVESLERQVEKLSQIVKQIFMILGPQYQSIADSSIGEESRFKKNLQASRTVLNNQKAHQNLKENVKILIQNMKNKCVGKQIRKFQTHKASNQIKQPNSQSNSHTRRHSFSLNSPYMEPNIQSFQSYSMETAIQSEAKANNTTNDEGNSCNCEEHFSKILTEYKEIIQTQHNNIMKKQKNNKLIKKQNEEFKNIIEEFKKSLQQYQNNFASLQDKISNMAEQKKIYTQKLLSIEKSQTKLKEQMKKTVEAVSERQKQIEQLIIENQMLQKEKKKISTKYKQQILHFQEMEKLVEQKLLEVEYEMNFYKKQRQESFQKIKKLENQLRQYKANQQKKYYSFGDSQKDVATQYDFISFNALNQEKNNRDKSETLQTSTAQQKKTQVESNRKEDILNNWNIDCYEQSIKTLLNENNRLKNTLLILYKSKKFDPSIKIDEQIELELKILASTSVEQKSFEVEVKQGKKGRKFIQNG